MSKKINKIDDDHYEFVTETKRVVSLKELEQKEADRVSYNATIDTLREQIKNVPEDLRSYINIPLDLPEDFELTDLIKELKNG